MVKEFYNKLIITLLLLVAIVVGIVLLWQNDRIEKNQIYLQKQATVKAVRSAWHGQQWMRAYGLKAPLANYLFPI